ncbi:MAG TPA: hypothetical protein VEI02_11040, partial [Planctomycetota bacterium]|nr:hypothetical protein [Planctomycetota bacterium]
AAAAATPPPPTRSEEDAETERLMAAARAAAGLPPAEAEAPTSAPSGGDAAPAEPRDQPFTEARREAFNRLLAGVRSSSKYAVVSASGVRDRKLRDAVVEVRGADGSLDKTIEARELSVRLSPRGEMCDLDFEGGSVSYHQTVGGRGAKSPFFNNRYQIVLLGVSAKDWLAAGFPFVAMK